MEIYVRIVGRYKRNYSFSVRKSIFASVKVDIKTSFFIWQTHTFKHTSWKLFKKVEKGKTESNGKTDCGMKRANLSYSLSRVGVLEFISPSLRSGLSLDHEVRLCAFIIRHRIIRFQSQRSARHRLLRLRVRVTIVKIKTIYHKSGTLTLI